jgi:hypothetical protein
MKISKQTKDLVHESVFDFGIGFRRGSKGNATFAPMKNALQSERMEQERLRYFLDCPTLFEEALPDGTPVFQTGLDGLENAAKLDAGQAGRRFGHKMESYFSAWLAGHERYAAMAQNLQFFSDGQTLGELDFLVSDRALGQVLHIELAYKFYILSTGHGSPEWVGPNRQDSLQAKLDKLRQRQFPLLRHPMSQKVLQTLGIDVASVRQMACLKGQLFLPKGYTGPLPYGVNAEAVVGSWTTFSRLESGQVHGVRYCLPAKEDWVLPPFKSLEWEAPEAAMAALKGMDRAQLCWLQYPDGSYERQMVLPEQL